MLILIFPVPSYSHDGLNARKALASARVDDGGVHLDVMVWMRLRGSLVKRLVAQFDFDRNGRFSGPEERAVARRLAPQAVGGLTVKRAGQLIHPQRAQYRATLKEKGVLEVAILLTYPIGHQAVSQLVLSSDMTKEPPKSPPLMTELSVVPPLVILNGDPPPKDGVIGPVKLVSMGASIEVSVGQAPAAKDPVATPKAKPE